MEQAHERVAPCCSQPENCRIWHSIVKTTAQQAVALQNNTACSSHFPPPVYRCMLACQSTPGAACRSSPDRPVLVWQIGHAISRDGQTWEKLGPIIWANPEVRRARHSASCALKSLVAKGPASGLSKDAGCLLDA